jgi:hypothetical protein
MCTCYHSSREEILSYLSNHKSVFRGYGSFFAENSARALPNKKQGQNEDTSNQSDNPSQPIPQLILRHAFTLEAQYRFLKGKRQDALLVAFLEQNPDAVKYLLEDNDPHLSDHAKKDIIESLSEQSLGEAKNSLGAQSKGANLLEEALLKKVEQRRALLPKMYKGF